MVISLQGGEDKITCTIVFAKCNTKSFYCFSPWENASLHLQCTLKSIFHKRSEQNCLEVSVFYYMPVLSSYVCDHASSPRISPNAEFL